MADNSRRSSDGLAMELMKQIGSKNGFEPVPWDQIGWQRRKGEPQLQRMWAWMISKTVRKGHFSTYAISKQGGEELHIEHAAKALGMELRNAYHCWQRGVELGLWRNGTKEEGKRKMFICGSVPQPTDEEIAAPETPELVRTYQLSDANEQKIKTWPAEQQKKFHQERVVLTNVRDVTLAELIKAGRSICDKNEDTHLLAYGLEVNRQEHKPKKAAPEEILARQKRVASILPHVELYVQTVQVFVQSQPRPEYKDEDKAAQTTPTLLGETPLRKGLRPDQTRKSTGSSRPTAPAHSDDGKRRNQLPALVPTQLTEKEADAATALFSEFWRMQQKYPHTEFGSDPVKKERPSSRLLVYRVLQAIGAENVDDFIALVWQKFKGDKTALGREAKSVAPGTPNGPRGFGLVWYWATQYGERLAEAARASAEEKARFLSQEIRAIRDLLADPNETEEVKAKLRERLRSLQVDAKGAAND